MSACTFFGQIFVCPSVRASAATAAVCLCRSLLVCLLALGATALAPALALADGPAHAFDPSMQKVLPEGRVMSGQESNMLKSLGARSQTLQGEAAHRPHWRQEVYPVVFGKAGAAQEILVLLDFAAPASQKVWQAVQEAARTLSPAQCKIVVFGKSRESYATDLLGLAIWLAHSRPGQAMPYLAHALQRWNTVKAGQRARGKVKPFVRAYDATLKPTDYPIHYAYFSQLRPRIPAGQELALSRYCYDAGNVNMYQTVQVCQFYDVKQLPAVIVNGRLLRDISAAAIVRAAR